MQIDIDGEGAWPFGLEHTRHDLALAMLQIADVFLGDLRHVDRPPSVVRRRERPPPGEIASFSLPRPARPDQCEFRGAIGPKLGWLRKSARADSLSQELACQPQRVALAACLFQLAACLFQIDKLYVAARPAVVADEPLGLVAGKVRFGIAIIMHRVGPALDPDR